MLNLLENVFSQKKHVGYFESHLYRRLSQFLGSRRVDKIELEVNEISRKMAESSQPTLVKQDRPFLNTISESILSTLNSNHNIKIIDIETYMVAPELSEEAIFTVRYGVRVYAVGTNVLRSEIAHIPVYSHGDGGFVSEYASRSRRNKLQVTDAIAEYIAMIIEMDGLDVGIRRSRNVMEGWLTVD